jgi:hypothetical protein
MLLRVGLIEPFIYHPFVVYSAILGNLDYLFGKSSWGEMSRKGFSSNAKGKPKRIQVVKEVAKSPKKAPVVKASITTWATVAIAVVGVCLYVLVDLDALLTRNEIALNPKIANLFTPEEPPAKKVIQKEREIFARTMNKAFNPIQKGETVESSKLADLRQRGITGPQLVGEATIEDTQTDDEEDNSMNQSTSSKESSEEKNEGEKTVENNREETPDPEPTVKEEEKRERPPVKTSPADDGRPETKIGPNEYFIIGGSYTRYKDAKEYYDLLFSSGFGRTVLIKTDGKYRVAFAKFTDKERAQDYLMNIRLNVHKDAWLYHK